jgi:hypothetical protein
MSSGKRSWIHQWSASELSPHDTLPNDVKFPAGSRYGDQVAGGPLAELPSGLLGDKARLGSPYAVSPTNRQLVATVYPTTGELIYSPSRQLAIVDTETKRVLQTLERQNDVIAVSWSPIGDQFAMVERHERYGDESIRDWFSSKIGHPIPYNDLSLAVLSSLGQELCVQRLAREVPYGAGSVSWKAPPQ